ncbi:MAG: hypothetical protein P8L85_20125, partial [Rubripirellula sp.]|nr:hypothetical protein [Rubripirellula sp.]
MRGVSHFETDLLRILQGVVSRTPIEQFRSQLLRGQLPPKCLCRDAIDLIEQSISTGVVMRITRSGAWQSSRHLKAGSFVEGSLWERTPPENLGLSFSQASLELLIDLTATQNAESMPVQTAGSKHTPSTYTLGDRLLQYYVAGAMADLPLLSDWYRQDPLISNQLIALTMPDRYAVAGSLAVLDLEAWMTGAEAILLEAMQPEFVE